MKKEDEYKWKYIDEPLKEKLRKNSVTNMVYFALTLPLMFIITPMILKFVSKEVYGIWALTGTILVFAEIFAGANSAGALGVVMPKFSHKKQAKDINEIINSIFVFYFFAAAVLMILFVLTEDRIIQMFFKVDENLISTVRFVLGVSFYFFLVTFVINGFAYIFFGFNTLYMVNILHIIMSYLRVGLMIGALYKGFGIKGIVLAQMSTILLEAIILLFLAKRVFPPLKFAPNMFRAEKLKMVFSLSVRLMATRLAGLVNQNVDKLVLGYFINPVIVAYYHIGASITKYISEVPGMISSVSLIQASSELKHRNLTHKVFNLYDRVNKYIFFLALLLASGMIIFGKQFIFLWLGEGYERSYFVMVFLCLGYTYALIGVPVMYILNGLEKVNGPMIIGIFSTALNIVLSVILAQKMGLTGALLGTVIAMFLGTSALYIMFVAIMKHNLRIINVFFKPAISIAIIYVMLYYTELNFRIPLNWISFTAKAAGFSILYVIFNVFILRQFDDYDIDLLRGFVPFLKKKG